MDVYVHVVVDVYVDEDVVVDVYVDVDKSRASVWESMIESGGDSGSESKYVCMVVYFLGIGSI